MNPDPPVTNATLTQWSLVVVFPLVDLPEGVSVGHWGDQVGRTGCTVVLTGGGAVAGVDVRGAAPGTLGTDGLRPSTVIEQAHAVLLTGGSLYGLMAAGGVMRWLEERRLGFELAGVIVPTVAGAVIFDLLAGDSGARPNAAAGYAACEAAGATPEVGAVGAGTGATVGKALGMEHCMKGGLGIATVAMARGIAVQAIVAVNAFGEIVEPNGRILAGVRTRGRIRPIDTLLDLGSHGPPPLTNTTIGVVVTNASLTREEANELASTAHDGLARTIRPVHTRADGDTLFVLATGRTSHAALPMLDVMALQHAASRAVAAAVVHAVRRATALAGIPACA